MGRHFGASPCFDCDGVIGKHEDDLQTISGLLERYQALRDSFDENDCYTSNLPTETDIVNIFSNYEKYMSCHDKEIVTELLNTITEIGYIISSRLKPLLDSHYKIVNKFVYDYENSKKPFEVLDEIKYTINNYLYLYDDENDNKENICADIIKIIDDYTVEFDNGIECIKNILYKLIIMMNELTTTIKQRNAETSYWHKKFNRDYRKHNSSDKFRLEVVKKCIDNISDYITKYDRSRQTTLSNNKIQFP